MFLIMMVLLQAAPPPLHHSGVVTLPTIIGPPSHETLLGFHPYTLGGPRISGHVELICTAQTDGHLSDCAVLSETPEGKGFGPAALRVARYIPVSPATNDGTPLESTVELRVDFPQP